MPEGTSLEYTDRVVREFESYLKTVNEVTHFVSFTGISSPMDFNGMGDDIISSVKAAILQTYGST